MSSSNVLKYSAWFRHVDTGACSVFSQMPLVSTASQKGLHTVDGDGRVTGQECKALFPRAHLSQKTLAHVWALSDQAGRGFLDIDAFCKAMELISMAQSEQPLSEDNWRRQQQVRQRLLPAARPHARTRHARVLTASAAVQMGIPPPRMEGLDRAVGDSADTESNPFAEVSQPGIRVAGGSLRRGMLSRRPSERVVVTSVVDGLKQVYMGSLRKIEEEFHVRLLFCFGVSTLVGANPIILHGPLAVSSLLQPAT